MADAQRDKKAVEWHLAPIRSDIHEAMQSISFNPVTLSRGFCGSFLIGPPAHQQRLRGIDKDRDPHGSCRRDTKEHDHIHRPPQIAQL